MEVILISKAPSFFIAGLLAFSFQLGFSAFSAAPVFAQDRSNHKIEYLSLSIGIFRDKEVSLAPKKPKLGGTFRKVTNVSYDSNKKVLRFEPKKAGVGTLIVQHPNTGQILYEYRIDVRKTNLFTIAREIKDLLGEIEGIHIRILNNKVIVDGQILLPRDMGRIHSVVKQYGDVAATLVTLSPLAQRKIAQLIERDINNPEVHVRAVNGKFILEGAVDSQALKDQAEIIAKTYAPDVVVDEAVADKKVINVRSDIVINLIDVRPPPPEGPKKIVKLTVHYVELQRDYTKGFRIQWTPDIGDGSSVTFTSGGRNPGGVVAELTGTIANLLPKLNWAKQHGHARVLQTTQVVVEDGNKGTINSTTRVPYQTVSAQGQPSTNFETTGIQAGITPQVLGARSDSVKLNIQFSVKALVGAMNGQPMVSERSLQTILVVRSGRSAAVGGLVSSSNTTNYNKLPENAPTNPLISLYASKDFVRNQSQFVVFVTPTIITSASNGAEQIKRKFRLRN